MQDDINSTSTETQAPPRPLNDKGNKFSLKTILTVMAGVMLLAGGVFIFWNLKKAGENIPAPTASPSVSGVETESTPSPTTSSTSSPTPTSSTAPKASKSKLSVKILNGTGIAGEAAYLKEILTKMGYSTIAAGNADDQTAQATTIAFSSSVDQGTQDELTTKLKGVYSEVIVDSSAPSGSTDIEITTGPRSGTSNPTPTP